MSPSLRTQTPTTVVVWAAQLGCAKGVRSPKVRRFGRQARPISYLPHPHPIGSNETAHSWGCTPSRNKTLPTTASFLFWINYPGLLLSLSPAMSAPGNIRHESHPGSHTGILLTPPDLLTSSLLLNHISSLFPKTDTTPGRSLIIWNVRG